MPEEPGIRVEQVKPYNDSDGKTGQVRQMFDAIAPAYDFMNNAMTGGLCRLWRNRALKWCGIRRGDKVLDVATGTGDVAFSIQQRYSPSEVIGVDLSEGMLNVGRRRLAKAGAEAREVISFESGDCLHLRFADESFDVATVAYGVRNFEHLDKGYAELYRVLKPGGRLCVIELSEPRKAPATWGYRFYTKYIIPLLGRLISGDSRAYSYLPESIAAVPRRDAMTGLMRQAGFREASWRSLTFGVVCIYLATK